MHVLFEAWWYGVEYHHIATFWNKSAAEAFIKEINDECQADVMEIETIYLVDNCGYWVKPAEYFV